ncbi:TetR/AcrR family transcriptional regulator [Corynebacterium sp.]|uniref:TetR/AcrR family transcriptional regulator n=1 Tax=Corynebacterium sp. TaxID=1720 RepID=UPI002A91D960|nr:TetR/AcrR family transcriptional regulator [Corynebacterium sp.]MDY5785058.1 TetR/AcrR family transcriptional regulator [Corynebacterium sp.]
MGRREVNRGELHEAFWRLLTQHPDKRISVAALTAEAGCNRGTFYYHFQDLEDFYDDVLTEVINETTSATMVGFISGTLTVETAMTRIVDLEPAVTQIGTLLNSSVSGHFRPRISETIALNWHRKLGINPSQAGPQRAVMEFTLGGILSMWAWRARQDPPLPLESLAQPEFVAAVAGLVRQLRLEEPGATSSEDPTQAGVTGVSSPP